MKKTLALVLALAMVFSTITVAFAEDTLSADAQTCADLGMLKGETGKVDAAYVATAPTRLQAAVMFLRLKGLEAEALAFTGKDNFADGDILWADGANLLAYLKANPQLGWVGDGTNFNPSARITAKEYYKVLLETLGYKQTSAEVVGDFKWDNVVEYAATVGLSKVADVAKFTVNDLATATVEALKTNVKDTETTLVASLVEAGKISKAAAIEAGLVAGAPAAVTVAVKKASAAGNAAVDVIYEDDVDAAAGNAAVYSIDGLAINAVTVTGSDSVRLDTAAMTSGKVYKLTVGEKTVQFTGVKKVSGGPEIKDAISEDVEEVVITFNKNIDLATGTDVANYSIAGVTIVSAEIDPDDQDEVILTTEGLKNKTKYTVKVTNVKSVDGVSKKSDSESFTSKYDLVAPKISGDIEVQTIERIVVKFTEKVSKETAEDLANYSIKIDEKDGASLEIVSVTWDDDDENNVEIVTEPMEKREDYKLSITNIADQRKVPNVIAKNATKTFKGVAEDKAAPNWDSIRTLSPTTILVSFKDASRIDESSALDLNNYELKDLNVESIKTIKDEWKEFKALLTVEEMETGKNYELKITDILDEFGNAMKETKKTASGSSNSFGAAYPTSVKAIEEDTIQIVFNDEVDEDSAENIANYDIDEGIGAPTEAKYEYKALIEKGKKEHVVTLKVNDIINGFENGPDAYDLTIDGVQDLAGNDLFYEVEVDTKTEKWDKSAPELESVDAPDLKTVALAFDEKVKYLKDANARLEVWYDINDKADPITKKIIYLPAKDCTDDNTVVEFSGAVDTEGKPYALVDGKSYTVVGVVYDSVYESVYSLSYGGVTDLIGNPLEKKDITVGDFVFEGNDEKVESAEVDTYEQTNGKTFEVTMSRFVKFADDIKTVQKDWDNDGKNNEPEEATAKISTVNSKGDFEVRIDEDVVTFYGDIKEGTEYAFNLAAFLVDYHGNPVENDDDTAKKTVFDGEDTDKDAPYIEEVVAIDRDTIKITFSEDIAIDSVSLGDFKLNNYDLTKKLSFKELKDNDGDKVIKLVVDKPLEARYEYELILTKGSIADIAGNKNSEEESFYFDGTNLIKLP
jgi:hypothetical protein